MRKCCVPQPVIQACLNHAVSSQAREKRLNPALLLTYQQYDATPNSASGTTLIR